MMHHGTTLAAPPPALPRPRGPVGGSGPALATPEVSRRAVLGAALALPVAGLLAACRQPEPAPSAGGPPAEVTYLTSFGVSARECFAHVADAKGFFAEANLRVTIEPGAAGDANHQALAGGAAQFAAVDSAGAMIRHANGVTGLRIIAAVHQLSLMALVSFEDTGIAAPADLRGCTIGLAAGSIAETLWPVYADLAGVDRQAVQTVPTSPATQVQELVAGRLDAIAQFAVSTPSLEAAGRGRAVRALPWSDFISDVYGNVVVAAQPLIDSDPDLVRRFGAALLRGLAYAVENPAEAGQILHDLEPTQDPDVAARELELMRPYVVPGRGDPIGVMRPERVARAVALLQSTGAVPASTDLTHDQTIMAWEFVPGADQGRAG